MGRHTTTWSARRVVAIAVAIGSSCSFAAGPPAGAAPDVRAFSDRSYWNQRLAPDAALAPDSDRIIEWIARDNERDHLVLAGASATGAWGMPIYWAEPSDPSYDVRNSCSGAQPAEFDSVRVPTGAEPDPTSDAAMVVYDRSAGLVFGFHKAAYDEVEDAWSACGGTVYYLRSNGLEGRLPQSNEPRNRGHRGMAPPAFAVRYDEILRGRIPHVLKIAVNTTKCEHVFPAVGDECGTSAAFAPPEGTRIRIQPTVRIRRLGLSPAALVIARALKRYGAVIGDQSGGSAVLKLENTIAEGRGYLWEGVLSADSLRAIPLEAFEVVQPTARS